MRALWLENQQLVYRTDLPIPQPSSGEALIRMKLAGICGTDLEMVKGYYPYTGVLGHEFVGEVVEAGAAPHLEGKRVVGEINITCGTCVSCQAGRATHCHNRKVLGIKGHDGVFADYFTLPVKNLHLVPENVLDEKAVFTELLASALEILDQVHIHPTDRVLVVGAGSLGQRVAQILALTGAQLEVVARYERQRILLAQRGITTISEDNVLEKSKDIVIDATGAFEGLELARKAVRPRGMLVLKSTYAGNVDFDASAFVVDEINLVGSRCGPFAPALRLLEQEKVNPTCDHIYPLTKGIEAFKKAAEHGVFKILLAS